jgi:hypothetical protein
MSGVFSLSGKNIHASARAALVDGLAQLAEHKNVPLNPGLREALAQDVLRRLDFAALYQITNQEEQGLITMVREVDAELTATVLARMWHLIALFEGKSDINDPDVHATARVIMDKFMATLPKQGVARWPDPMQLVADHYARVPRGPVAVRLEDGSVLTSYLLGWKPHRDPEEGPAVHWAHGGKQKWEYRVMGELHRPHEDGPAMICTHYQDSSGQPCEISGEEYYQRGKLHRPAELGPAVINRGQAGETVAEGYYENGERHRDPKEGPALWLVLDARTDPKAGRPRTEIEYRVRGKLHRPETDGPAMTVRDNATGVIMDEQYWRDGKRHRDHGPAHIRRDETRKVLLEAWCAEGKLHRDPKEGPALWQVLDGPHGYSERPCTEIRYCVRGELHRDEEDGPAWTKRDNETGVPVTEEYWRDGDLHREDGPAVITRWPESTVSHQAWWQGDRMRDASEGPCALWHDPQGRPTGEEWCVGGGHERDASEGPGRIHRDLVTGEVRQEFFSGGDFRRAPEGPAVVTLDREGNVVQQAFWDGERMHAKYPEPAAGEANAHG